MGSSYNGNHGFIKVIFDIDKYIGEGLLKCLFLSIPQKNKTRKCFTLMLCHHGFRPKRTDDYSLILAAIDSNYNYRVNDMSSWELKESIIEVPFSNVSIDQARDIAILTSIACVDGQLPIEDDNLDYLQSLWYETVHSIIRKHYRSKFAVIKDKLKRFIKGGDKIVSR